MIFTTSVPTKVGKELSEEIYKENYYREKGILFKGEYVEYDNEYRISLRDLYLNPNYREKDASEDAYIIIKKLSELMLEYYATINSHKETA